MELLEHYGAMWEHLKYFFISSLFNPPIWLAWGVIYALGWITGKSFGSHPLGRFVILGYLLACILGFLFRSSGWDVLILFGFPFIVGIMVGKK